MNKALIIIPTYNESANIKRTVADVFKIVPRADILVVDDNSPDGTAERVKRLKKKYRNRLNLLVRLGGKSGRGSAVLEGMNFGLKKNYQQILEMDADYSHDPHDLPKIFAAGKEADIVIGSRYAPGSKIVNWPLGRRVFSKLSNFYARTILGVPIVDYTNGFRLYSRRALEALDFSQIKEKGYIVLSEVAYQLHKKNSRFAEVPTLFVNRRRGKTNLSIQEIKRAFLTILNIRLRS